ncbi:unnamed protein product [Trifolium pratense]|uniref:Uncharacterized protein n=1 Tax=Trifolium pratense TaxID=57577 RepID=A0ACB0L308_TRIPR|nr:unnamed protein product [Trifolium pratense]
MLVCNEYGKSFLNVYALNNSSNDVIEVCRPLQNHHGQNLVIDGFEISRLGLTQGRVRFGKLRRNGSLVCFWFRKKFPRIALWFFVESGKHFDNMVLDFKLKVLINGTTQLISSCEYISYTQKETEQMLCCDLQCKVEGVFSKNEWNWVEILCEMEHLMPCDSKWVMAHKDWITKMILKCSLLYVYPEKEEDDFSLLDNLASPPLLNKQKFLHLCDEKNNIKRCRE